MSEDTVEHPLLDGEISPDCLSPRSPSQHHGYFKTSTKLQRHRVTYYAKRPTQTKRTRKKSIRNAKAYKCVRRHPSFISQTGHEHPYAIKMSHVRDASKATGDDFILPIDVDPSAENVDPQYQCQFFLRNTTKAHNKLSLGKSLYFHFHIY